MKAVHENLVDQVWTTRPAPPQAPLIVLENKYAGQSFETKIESIQASLTSKNCWGIVVSALDEIAWLFNLRGSDIAFNPVFHSYALLTPTSATLYVDPSKVDQKVRAHLGSKVNVKPYGAIFEDVKALGLVSAVSGQV